MLAAEVVQMSLPVPWHEKHELDLVTSQELLGWYKKHDINTCFWVYRLKVDEDIVRKRSIYINKSN